jgi:GMP synthase-like glutamine amidotransferase
MKPVLIVTHLEDRCTGLVRGCLEQAGHEVLQVDKVDGDPLPAVSSVSGIVSMGGRESATRAGEDPFLSAEVELMGQALARAVPLLGLCLGAQLLAVAGGGQVSAIGRMVADWEPISLRPAAAVDPVFDALPDGLAVLKWHEDMIEAPAGATALATAPGPGTALFRLGARAWGSQAHLEVTPRLLIDTWLADPGSSAEIEGAGHPIDAFRALSRRALERQMVAGRAVFGRFAAVVSDRSAGGRPSDRRRR